MIRQVVSDHPEAARELRILEQVAPLAGIGAGGVLQQRDTSSGLFEVDAILDVDDVEMDVAAGGGIEAGQG